MRKSRYKKLQKVWWLHHVVVTLYRVTDLFLHMDTTLTIENIYNMLSSLSSSNKKWLADHLYEDLALHPFKHRRSALSDEELAKELENESALDMDDYKPLTDEQYKLLLHSKPVTKNVVKWL